MFGERLLRLSLRHMSEFFSCMIESVESMSFLQPSEWSDLSGQCPQHEQMSLSMLSEFTVFYFHGFNEVW